MGFYCGEGDTCTADCSGPNDSLCGDGRCSNTGTCNPPDGPDAGPADQGGARDFGPAPDFGPVPDQGDGVCARVTVEATRVTPNVIFIVDRSRSMEWELDLSDGAQCPFTTEEVYDCYDGSPSATMLARSRWRELRSTLIGTTAAPAVEGLIGDLQGQVRFGLVTYRFTDGTCLRYGNMSPVDVGGDTYIGVVAPGSVPTARDVIAGNGVDDGRYLDVNPGGGTPTGPAIDFIVDNLDPSIAASGDPTILILATDGNPTHTSDCSDFPNYTTDAREWSVGAVQRAHAAGIRTFVLAVADESEIAQDHIDDLANAGIGELPTQDPPAMSWRVEDSGALNDALTDIIGAEISCTIQLNGSVPTWDTDPCAGGTIDLVEGAVRMPIQCSPGNGWQLTGPSTVEIMGTACDMLKAATNASLDASFPCDTVIFG